MGESDRSFSVVPYMVFQKNARAAIRWLFSGKYLPTFVFFLLAVFSSAVIGYLKADALLSWTYSSDLFSFDTVLQEMLRGHIGLEFTYCNAFGDHAYLFLFLLAPLKLLLSTKMIYLLVLLGPLCYLVSSVIFFLSARQIVHPWKAFLVSAVFLFGFGKTYLGLFESLYGLHPDTFAGYLAAAAAALLIWKESNEAQGRNAKAQTLGAVIFLLVFLLLKEEMAILGLLFCLVVLGFRRTPLNRNLALLSALVLGIDLILLALARTPFNRTNNSLISGFLQNFRATGLSFFFNNPQVNPQELQSFWLAIALGCLMFGLAAVLSRRINPYGLGLLLAGLLKMLFGAALQDYNIIVWHNFAGLVMITAACLIQILFVVKSKNLYPQLALILLTVISVVRFLSNDVPFVKNNLIYDTERKREVSGYHKELSQFMEQVDPAQVVSIPILTVKRWVGYRYAFYPRGVSMLPVGVADYVVYPVGKKALSLAYGYADAAPPPDLLKSFSQVAQTPHFILFKRTALSESEKASRDACLPLR